MLSAAAFEGAVTRIYEELDIFNHSVIIAIRVYVLPVPGGP